MGGGGVIFEDLSGPVVGEGRKEGLHPVRGQIILVGRRFVAGPHGKHVPYRHLCEKRMRVVGHVFREETDDFICEGKLPLRDEASDGERRKAFRDGEHAVKKRRIIGGEILLLVERSAVPYEDAVKGEWKMSAGKFRDRIHEDFSFL